MSKSNRRQITPPIKVSQNFLTSTKLIEELIHKTTINSSDHVLEIGPGKGHITRQLLKRCGRLTAVELDKGLYHKLLDSLVPSFNGRFSLVHSDFLQWKLPFKEEYKVFSNIPFCITTQIMKKLFIGNAYPHPPKEAWLIMEKGAAKRFLGEPNENSLSLALKPLYRIKIVHHFRREDFHPCPSVDVVMLYVARKDSPDLSKGEWFHYKKYVDRCFTAGIRSAFTKNQYRTALRMAKLPPDFVRGEVLYTQWLCLFRCYARYQL